AIELSLALSNMVEAGYTAAAMEVSSHSLDQGRVAALDFDVAIFTNITGDHLDYHKSFESYAEAKSKLFRSLRPEALAIVNADDPHADRVLQGCRARVLRCSATTHAGADCFVRAEASSFDGATLGLVGPWGECSARTPLIGAFNAMN
ncbi:MAG TPA: UDP-N-acetylmuramoyl-L-alanyl-D-glutamate--2,6-diaminopimelate ligase, partial [Phycisphaerales bacterium]|nr:UDP-N-acetylmuramoyl-L-alanyl-D-glutamate--2,6-diaminopimelate ligase [Phycisphaerales bacterium]